MPSDSSACAAAWSWPRPPSTSTSPGRGAPSSFSRPYRREIVVTVHRADHEFPVVGLLHPPVFPHHHAGYLVGALNVRDIEAFDSPRSLIEPECVLERLLNRLRRRLQHAETLLEAMLSVRFHQLEHGLLLPPL